MSVYTGGVGFLESLKGKKLPAKPLRGIMSLQESIEVDNDRSQAGPSHQSSSYDFQENLRSGSSSVQGYNKQSSNQPKEPKYTILRRQGTTGIDGQLYEIDLLTLGKLRGDRDANKFYLSTNRNRLGAFDDVAMKYWKNGGEDEKPTTIFLQAKHVADSKKGKVTIEKFINPENDKFYLGKYFLDYLNIRERIGESEDPLFQGDSQFKFIIYTNAILDEKFDKDRITDIENSIFSTKSKEDKDKGFKFSPGDKNSDVIKVLEKVSCQERVKLLAKTVVSCISGKLSYEYKMKNEFSTYHVFLAKNVIDVGEGIKEDGKKNKYREGKINPKFLNTNNIDSLEKLLENKVLYEYAENVVFKKKSSSELDDVSKRNDLVKKVAESLKLYNKVNNDVIEKLGGSVIILDTKSKQLKFAGQNIKLDKSDEQFIRDLKSKVGELEDKKFDIPYELVKKLLEEQKETLKLHVSFGNISPSFKKPEHLIKILIELFKKYKSEKVVKIDDSVVGHKKELTNGDIENIGKLVGNLLVFDKKKKMLKLASEESLDGAALELIKKLKTTAQSKGLEVDNYRFDITVKNFPRNALSIDGEDRTNVEEFLGYLEVFTGQASDPELREVIKDEIKNLYKLTEKEVEESFLKIRNKAEECWKERRACYIVKDDNFFADIVKFNIRFDVKETVTPFAGREKELNDLHKKMQDSSEKVTGTSRIVSISGLGGMGKTQLARRYVYDHKNDYYGNVIWIDAQSYQTLAESFSRLAIDRFEIRTMTRDGRRKDITSIMQDVYEFLAERKSLIIFDNAENIEVLRQFLPLTSSDNNNKPYVLITSRIARAEWERVGIEEGITLGMFTEKEAISFVRKALRIDNGDNSQDNEIRELAIDVLYRFPLALEQAVGHIKEEIRMSGGRGKGEYTIVKYLEDFKTREKELLNSETFRRLDNDYEKTTLKTWIITTDKIKDDNEHGELALKILDIIAYLAPKNIPVESFFLKLEENKEKLWKAVELLHRYSMVELDSGKADIHQLVQKVMRINSVDEKREEETLRKALELINVEKIASSQGGCCLFYPFTAAYGLSNIEMHATYIWSYASKYSQLIKDFYSAYGENRNTPINLFARTGEIEAIKSILQNVEKGELVEKVNDYNQAGYAPIHSAAFNGHKDIVEYFIEKQDVGVNFFTYNEYTPTFVAVLGNQLHVVKYLVGEKGADLDKGGKYGSYPILFAAFDARKNILEYLVEEKVNILVSDPRTGNNVLLSALHHLRICSKHTSDIEWIVDYLLKENSDLVKHKNHMGMTPLHYAAGSGSDRIITMLLEYGADVNAKSHIGKPQVVKTTIIEGLLIRKDTISPDDAKDYDKGYTPLHIAAHENRLEAVKLLLKHGAIYSAINDERNTPLVIAEFDSDVDKLLKSIDESFKATRKGKKDKLDSLLKGKHSDVLEAILNARDLDEKTLLQVATDNKQEDIAEFIEKKLKIVKEY